MCCVRCLFSFGLFCMFDVMKNEEGWGPTLWYLYTVRKKYRTMVPGFEKIFYSNFIF